MLPFTDRCEIRAQNGDLLADEVPVRVEGAGTSTVGRGVVYDWTGEIHESAAPHLIRQRNRHLVIDSQRYNVVEAFQHDFVPHVELRLLEVRGG